MNIQINKNRSIVTNLFRSKKNKIKSTSEKSSENNQPVESKIDSQNIFTKEMKFDEMPLDSMIKENLKLKGYVNLTPIQVNSFEHILNKKNIVGIANTGTGKTAAFLLPLINNILNKKINDKIIVVVPTRELALQVADELNSLTESLPISAATFIGGTSVSKDINKLKRRNHFIIGTPGRLIDLMNQNALDLSSFEVVVIDEFDRMLDMGFVKDVNRILDAMKNRKQTILFSATIDEKQEKMVAKIAPNYVKISVSSGNTTSKSIQQNNVLLNGRDKFQVFANMLKNKDFKKVLVFSETKRSVDKLNKKLLQAGFKSDTIHGNKSQNYRIKALGNFKTGNTPILVATDIAARGIDINDITHVINYQMPKSEDSYIHRIGRTGRAGKVGTAFTFVD